MEKRLLLAVVLMMAVVFLVNILFPPAPAPERPPPADTTAARVEGRPAPPETLDGGTPAETREPERRQETAQARDTARDEGEFEFPEPTDERAEDPVEEAAPEVEPEDTVWVNGPLYRYGFSSRGARLIFAELPAFESLSPDREGLPVQLVPPDGPGLFSHAWVVGDDTLDLRNATFRVEPAGGLEVAATDTARTLTFIYEHPSAPFAFEVSYVFEPDRYRARMEGRLRGVPATGWWVLGLGSGLLSNEWNPEDDYQNNLAFAAHGPDGVESEKISDIGPNERLTLDGPFDWVGIRTKYFVAAVVLPQEIEREGRFAGLLIEGIPEEYRALGRTSFPVGRDGTFDYQVYIGPQDYGRLAAVGHDLDQVTPYGYAFLQPIIRPLVGAITDLLVWSHNVLKVNYGWILILFGVAIRIVLFPLYQKSMRTQLATMRVQPLMKEIQSKYKGEPQKMQQEMMKLYREHKINPLGGCLPMLLPFPILIALFFVFRDTIEFRGVPFMWLPDLSQPDPYYIIPVLMGLSVFLLQWIGQKGMTEVNPQMKIMMWVMPVFLTVLFLNFASGLNLYYATMNLASIPQQLYLARERKAAADAPPVKARS